VLRTFSKMYSITASLAITAPLTAQSEVSLQSPPLHHVDLSSDPTSSSSQLPTSRTASLVGKVWRMSSRRGTRAEATKDRIGPNAKDNNKCILFQDLFEKADFSSKARLPSS
jgi:hypothetical protein